MMNNQSREYLEGSERIWYDLVMNLYILINSSHRIYEHAILIEYITLGMNTNMNCGIWQIMMHQWRFIHIHKYTTLVRDVDNGGRHLHVRVGVTKEISAPFSQFCCEPKNSLKNSIFCKVQALHDCLNILEELRE